MYVRASKLNVALPAPQLSPSYHTIACVAVRSESPRQCQCGRRRVRRGLFLKCGLPGRPSGCAARPHCGACACTPHRTCAGSSGVSPGVMHDPAWIMRDGRTADLSCDKPGSLDSRRSLRRRSAAFRKSCSRFCCVFLLSRTSCTLAPAPPCATVVQHEHLLSGTSSAVLDIVQETLLAGAPAHSHTLHLLSRPPAPTKTPVWHPC